ncbi:MAG: hypothetical protein ACXVXO_11880 [Mycobacteriaceae bacterium]
MTEQIRQPGDLAGPPLANPERLHDGDGPMIYRRPEAWFKCCNCCLDMGCPGVGHSQECWNGCNG